MAQLSSSTVFGDLTVTNNINIFGSLNSTSINIGGVRKDENWDIAYTHSQTAHAPSNANYYVHPSVNHIPTGGAAGNILQWSSSGTAAWKANGTTSQYLRGDGAWASPPNTATAVDDILDGSNSGTAITYKPYTTNLAATGNRFYTHNTMPTATTLLNLSSHLRITQGTIGTTLTVNGDIIGNGKVIARTTDGWLRLNPTYTSSPPATAFHSGVLIPSALSVSGDVGIGTTSPSEKLEVRGNIRLVGAGGTGDGSLEIWRGTNASWKILNTSGKLKFQSNFTSSVGNYYDAMILDYNTGNLWFKGSLTGGTIPWERISGAPSTFNPATHTHSNITITAGNGLSGGGTLAANRTITLGTPGTITTSTSNSVTSTSHTHALTLPTTATRWPSWSEVTGKPSTFPPSSGGTLSLTGTSASNSALTVTGSADHSAHINLKNTGTSGGNFHIIATNSGWSHGENRLLITSGGASSTNFVFSVDSAGNPRWKGSLQEGTVPWARISGAPATATSHPTWAQVTGKPSTFTPSSHSHGAGDLPSASTSAKGVVQLSTSTSSTSTTLAATASAVKAAYDVGNHSHPYAPSSHTHTASQVGLGNVQNYGIATKAQAEAGTANSVYMTPLRVKEAIASLVPDLPCFYKLIDSVISSGEVGISQAAGVKNSMYRGKNLGTSVTSEQWANIANGTFKDMYIGDYWVINGTTYIIAAFNYYLNTSGTLLTTKHVTLVTAESMYTHRMNTKSLNDEGYVGSEMYTTGLDEAKTRIHADFAGHVLTHKRYLCNAVADGQASAAAWFDSDVELMNEVMVYGSIVNGKSDYGYNIGVEKSQLPLFALRPDLVNIGIYWWLRDVVSALYFAAVGGNGLASRSSNSNARGVRPVFSIF